MAEVLTLKTTHIETLPLPLCMCVFILLRAAVQVHPTHFHSLITCVCIGTEGCKAHGNTVSIRLRSESEKGILGKPGTFPTFLIHHVSPLSVHWTTEKHQGSFRLVKIARRKAVRESYLSSFCKICPLTGTDHCIVQSRKVRELFLEVLLGPEP